jgi:carbohydrate-selective porin OprB
VNNRENIIVRFGQKRTVRITFWNLTQIWLVTQFLRNKIEIQTKRSRNDLNFNI